MATYDQIFRKNHYNLSDAAKKSSTWFQQQARMLSGKNIVPGRLIRTNSELNVTRITPGELYLFQYDAKWKDELPFWDTFPLVFPFRRLNDGFIGLNMHYLPYQIRVRLLDQLMTFKTSQSLDENTRLRLSWSTINGLSTLKVAEHCVHRYLIDHVKSPFKRIESPDWATAMMLPVERFVGATKQQVWKSHL